MGREEEIGYKYLLNHSERGKSQSQIKALQ